MYGIFLNSLRCSCFLYSLEDFEAILKTTNNKTTDNTDLGYMFHVKLTDDEIRNPAFPCVYVHESNDKPTQDATHPILFFIPDGVAPWE